MKTIVLFTVGFHARAAARHLLRRPDVRLLAFVDNNPRVHGTSLLGLPVLAPEALRTLECDLVAVPGRNQAPICAQLRERLGVPGHKIWRVLKSEVPPSPDELERRGAALAGLLARTTAVLDRAGIDYWSMHSSLLGLMRGDDLALFSDLDFCVDGAGFAALEHGFDESFRPKIVRTASGSSLVQISVRSMPNPPDDEPALVDLHPMTIAAQEARWSVNGQDLSLPLQDLFPSSLRSYRGVPIRIPAEPARVLDQLYGKEWGTAAESWNGRYAVSTPSTLQPA